MKNARKIIGVVAMAASVFVAVSMGACGGGETGSPPVQGEPDIEGVIYGGLATDEALLAMLLLTEKTDPAQGVVVDVPAAGASLPRDIPPTLSWHVGGGSAAIDSFTGTRFVRAMSAMVDWMGPRVAWAHGAPVNGRAYLLEFSTPDAPGLVRVFTTELSYTFDAGTWGQLALQGKNITLRITNAIFESNRVALDGGPFAGEPVTFSIAP